MLSKGFALSLFALLVVSVGCAPAPAPAPKVKALAVADVSAGLSRLTELRDAIKAAFDAGTPHECDGALHEASDILNDLPAVAANQGLDEEAQGKVKSASAKLFEALMVIHEGFHGHGGATADENAYEGVAEDIEAGLQALAEIVGEPTAEETAP